MLTRFFEWMDTGSFYRKLFVLLIAAAPFFVCVWISSILGRSWFSLSLSLAGVAWYMFWHVSIARYRGEWF